MLGWVYNAADNLRKIFTTQTETYGEGQSGSTASSSILMHLEERPQFNITAAEQMTFDSKVTIALGIRNGILKQAKVKVSGHPTVAAFVKQQWERIWDDYGSALLKTKIYGFKGFEVVYRRNQAGMIEVAELRDFHPRDTRPLVYDGRVVGLTVRVPGSNKIPLFGMKGLWATFRPQNCRRFGESLLEHAYPPWFEKWQRGGAVKMRQLRMMKDAWIGDIIRYPSQKKIQLPTGEVVSYRELCRELVEMRKSGGVLGIPSDSDPTTGKPFFDYTPPTHIDGATMIFEYCKVLDDEIVEGCEVAREVVSAAETGSGFSGRSIPFIATISAAQEEIDGLVKDVNRHILQPMALLNFGSAEYRIAAESLVDTVGKLMGGDGESDSGSPRQSLSGPAGGYAGGAAANYPDRGNPESRYGNSQFSDASDVRPPAYIDRTTPRKTTRWATVGGVPVAPGVWVGPSALRFASDDELGNL